MERRLRVTETKNDARMLRRLFFRLIPVQIMKTALFRGVPIVMGVAAAVCLAATPLTGVFYRDPSAEVFRLTELLTMDEGFGVPRDRRLAITVREAGEVPAVSERVIAFCREMGPDAKRAFHAGLCMEELTANVVQHGFCDGKQHSVELRVVKKADTLLLRIKDDCRRFNPKEVVDMMDPADVTHNIGLRIVSRFAREMNYNSALGLNVLSIEL